MTSSIGYLLPVISYIWEKSRERPYVAETKTKTKTTAPKITWKRSLGVSSSRLRLDDNNSNIGFRQWCGLRPSVLGQDGSESEKSVLVLVLQVW